jgi:hypothetical protein
VTDFNTVLLATAPAAITGALLGGVGYYTARLQSRDRIRELEQQVWDKRRDERLDAFSDLLACDANFQSCVRSRRLTPEWWHEFFGERYGPTYGRVTLLAASADTGQPTNDLMDLYTSVVSAAAAAGESKYSEVAFTEFQQKRAAIEDARNLLAKGMRKELESDTGTNLGPQPRKIGS